MSLRLARRAQGLRPSAVREILKAAERPDVLSFAGGLPAPELFPSAELALALDEVLAARPGAALQCGVTEGYGPLREWVAARLRASGVPASADRVLMTSGSQQGIDLVARLLLNPGDVVLVENPTYLAALQAFAAAEATVVALPGDDDGLCVDALEEAVAAHQPALLYLVPDFQNPRGTTLAAARRQTLADVARRHGLPVLEDNPYGELRFRGEAVAPLAALADDVVFSLGTFSKTLAPGLRLGWVHAPADAFRALVTLKQASDLHTGTLAQHAAAALLEAFDFDAHLGRLRRVYGERCLAMQRALDRAMPRGTRWTAPDGGLFLWLELPFDLDDGDVFRAALERQVAVVPGSGFFAGPPQHGFLRLNFSNVDVPRIELGVARLAEALCALRPTERWSAAATT